MIMDVIQDLFQQLIQKIIINKLFNLQVKEHKKRNTHLLMLFKFKNDKHYLTSNIYICYRFIIINIYKYIFNVIEIRMG